MSLWNDIKLQFRSGNILMQLIYVNGAVFILMMILRMLLFLSTGDTQMYELFSDELALPATPIKLLMHPWSILTHMFVHTGFLHILFNMLWLYFGGTIFMNFLDSRKLLSTYLLGGLSGAFTYMLAMNLIPAFASHADNMVAMGASAAVLAIVVAAATTVPNYVVRLVLIGPVKLKYIALVSVLLDMLYIPDGNAGGHFAHLGGALYGFMFALSLQKGTDISIDVLGPLQWVKRQFSGPKKKFKVVHRRGKTDEEYNAERTNRQAQIDAILDKIKQSGYESLTDREKALLFDESRR